MITADNAPSAISRLRRMRTQLIAGIIVIAGLLTFVLANLHLVYVAVASQPGCAPHLKQRDPATAPSSFQAARSSC